MSVENRDNNITSMKMKENENIFKKKNLSSVYDI